MFIRTKGGAFPPNKIIALQAIAAQETELKNKGIPNRQARDLSAFEDLYSPRGRYLFMVEPEPSSFGKRSINGAGHQSQVGLTIRPS